jgi:hypothetical protein
MARRDLQALRYRGLRTYLLGGEHQFITNIKKSSAGNDQRKAIWAGRDRRATLDARAVDHSGTVAELWRGSNKNVAPTDAREGVTVLPSRPPLPITSALKSLSDPV